MKLDNSEMPALPKADWYESTVVPEDTPLYTEDQMRTAMRASADAQLAKLRDQKPVAWFRNENGMRVYYETVTTAPTLSSRDARQESAESVT